MSIDLSKMEDDLKNLIGTQGIQFLSNQMEVLRLARNLPKDIDEQQLTINKYRLCVELIAKWLVSISEYVQNQIEEDSTELLQFQENVKIMLQEQKIKSWKEAIENPEIGDALKAIQTQKKSIINQQKDLMYGLGRSHISTLAALVLYPYLESRDFDQARERAKEVIGPNDLYKKDNIHTDALILMLLAEHIFGKKSDKASSFKLIYQIIGDKLEFVRSSEKQQWDIFVSTKGKEGSFSPRQTELMLKNVLNIPKVTPEMKKEIETYYIPMEDKYSIPGIMDWLLTQDILKIYKDKEDRTSKDDKKFHREIRHLLGLWFLDKHRRTELIGNVPESSFDLFEKIMAPFTELKQTGTFFRSAQFGINSWGLPEHAWFIDFTGIKTNILRSTLLLLSDRNPKFDVLESCQRFCNAVLGGRVDRNDLRKENDPYIYTDKLPKETWDYISENLVNVLEEALVREERAAVMLLRNLFSEEDHSNLVTSRKFIPAFYIDFTSKNGTFLDITIYKNKDLELQFRHVQAAGYPWYYESNTNLESLVITGMEISDSSKIKGNVSLRQIVYKVDDEFYIIYFNLNEKGLSVLAFREVDILVEDSLHPVEILFRPKKYLERGPQENNLNLILDKARATDPKDLATIISQL